MANDNRPYSITKLRELWPDKWAVGALFKTPSGGSHRRKTMLDPYLPTLKKALGLGDGLHEYALVYFSW